MVKATEKVEEQPVEAKKSGIKNAAVKLVVIGLLAGGGYALWQNPQLIEKAKNAMIPADGGFAEAEAEKTSKDMLLSQTISNLSNQVNFLLNNQNKTDVSALSRKIENMEINNSNIIKSKADVASVLGIVTRLDRLEAQINRLAQVSDENAVVLTAAMLVKDAADRGGSFEYEAEIFKQIAADVSDIAAEVATIEKYAVKGVPSKNYLLDSFDGVYAGLLKEQREVFEKTWKDRINNKLSEYIKVKRVDENAPAFEANSELAQVKAVVDTGNIKKALFDIESLPNQELLNNFKLKEWVEQARAYVEFNDAVSKISLHYLAVMKVNFIKKG